MTYIAHTDTDIQRMLSFVGVKSIEELFNDIPLSAKLKGSLKLPAPLSEPEVLNALQKLAAKNSVIKSESSFLGGGANRHYIPSVVDKIINRSEFLTAYTPYQPEISQGTLQAIFEFQSLVCFLTDMDVANASLYDGATATAEAALMAMRITKRKKLLLSPGLHPNYQAVLQTYLKQQQTDIVDLPLSESGDFNQSALNENLDDKTGAIIVQYPNFFGVIQDLHPIAQKAHEKKALLIVVITEPIALGMIKPPGSADADIVVGDAQSFGLPLNYGGPYIGFMSAKQKFVRQMPGRIVGETVDKDGKRGFVLTLSTREQHIRRERATSNICTNQGLCALAASITMAILGKNGLKKLAYQIFSKSEFMKDLLKKLPSVTFPFSNPTFNEFVIKADFPLNKFYTYMVEKSFAPGIRLERFDTKLKQHLLISVTEMNSRSEIERFVDVLNYFID